MSAADIKRLIERLRQRSNSNHAPTINPPKPAPDLDCRAAANMLEQYLPTMQELSVFRQEVPKITVLIGGSFGAGNCLTVQALQGIIIPATKPDPLVEVMKQAGWADAVIESCAPSLRAALDARGLEIREKVQ
jgi:hypothetical protein